MGRGNNYRNDRLGELDDEIERYREAAASALGQLEWIVGYLHKIRKDQIARALDRNRKQIIEEIRDFEEPQHASPRGWVERGETVRH
jgi:hypothetical protein